MGHNTRRSAAALSALFLACLAPRLWAANVVSPAAARSAATGMAAPLPVLPHQAISGMTLGALQTLSGPALSPASLVVPQVSPAPGLLPSVAAPAALGLTAAPAALPAASVGRAQAPAAAQAPTAVKVSALSEQVSGLLEDAGPVAKASAESAQSLGGKVIRALTGEAQISADGVVADPVAAPAATLTQQKMLHTLYEVAAVFAEQYAPIEWKKDQFQVDLKREYEKAKAAILADPKITTRSFQDLLAGLTSAMRDYHVSISFNSTERARLPFTVTGAGGKYFMAYIDRDQLPAKDFPVQVGDEVVAFDGKPTGEAVKALADRLGANVAETDMRLAEIFLTNRRRSRGDKVPQGPVSFVVRRQDGKLAKVQMEWDYTPELVPQDVPVRDAGLLSLGKPGKVQTESGINDPVTAPQLAGKTLASLLKRAVTNAIHPLAGLFADMRAESAANPFMMGARQSFVPQLGKVLWKADDKDPFHAYIFATEDGRKAGFIRIPAYDGGAKEAKRFGEIMAKFQKETDSLVIDQVNNPGGDVFYMYALLSHLTDKPLVTPHHRLIIGEGEAQWAADLLLKVMQPAASQKSAPKAAADEEDEEEQTASGYPVTQKFLQLFVRYAQFVLKQFDSGKRFTDLTWVNGVDSVDPAPKAEERYTKPILLLTSALDFSGGDFFPAIMQDNKRVTQLGVRTAGAGGMVKEFPITNQFGVADLNATWSIAERPNGRPIENLGVTPDIAYDFTENDMHTGFAEYRAAILKAVQDLMGAAPAKVAPPAPVKTPLVAPAKARPTPTRPNRPNKRR